MKHKPVKTMTFMERRRAGLCRNGHADYVTTIDGVTTHGRNVGTKANTNVVYCKECHCLGESNRVKRESKPTEEKIIQNDILREFGTRPDIRLWRMNAGVSKYRDRTGKIRQVQFGVPGQADLTGILPDGRRLEIEVKGPTGEQSKAQIDYQRIIERFNGVYILARSCDDVDRALRTAGVQIDAAETDSECVGPTDRHHEIEQRTRSEMPCP